MKFPAFSLISGLALAGAALLGGSTLSAEPRINVSVGVGSPLPHGYAEVRVGKDRYYTHRGNFYRHDPRVGLVVVRAPRGAVLRHLPPHHVRVYVDGVLYYRCNEVFYSAVPDGYVVVETPVKVVKPATVVEDDYQSVWLDGTEYLCKDGQFFRRTADGLVWMPAPLGAVTKVLPSDARSIWYEGTEYFEADDVYFRKKPEGFQVVNAPWKKPAGRN